MVVNNEEQNGAPVNRDSVVPTPEATPTVVEGGEENTDTKPEAVAEAVAEGGGEDELDTAAKMYFDKYFGKGEAVEKPEVTQPQPGQSQSEKLMKQLEERLNSSPVQDKKDPTNFREFIANEDWKGAEDYVARRAEQAALQKMEDMLKTNSNQLLENAIQGASAKVTIENTKSGILNTNPDLKPFADFLEYKSESMVQEAKESGKIKTITDYTQAKIVALESTAKELRKQLGIQKGKGKLEGKKKNEEVLASSVSDNEKIKGRTEPQEGQADKPVSTADYIAMRKAEAAKMRGM